MLEQTRTNEMQARSGPSSASGTGPGGAQQQDQGYWAYMQKQMQERTEQLGQLGESVNQLGEASSSWAEEAGKYVQKTKRNLVLGAVKGKFGI